MRSRLPLAALALLAAPPVRAGDIDSELDRDPAVPAARLVNALPPRLPGLWIEALARPDADTKAQAAQAIARAHERGFAGVGAAAGALARELDRPDPHPTVRAAVVRALVVLDAKDAAAALARAAAADPELREVVDPALARWDFQPARAEWLARLATADRRGTVLAARALGAVRESAAAPRLRELALDKAGAPAVRLEAARALAEVRPAGGEADARALAADPSARGLTDRLVAAALLRRHAGDEAVKVLLSLARDPEPAVAAVALARLVELDPAHVLPLLNAVLASPDAAVRGSGVEVLFRRPDAARVRLLADRLADPHPAVRRRAREALRDLAARPEWNGPVLGEATRVLGGADWRGLEQAALLLGGLDHKPAAPRLVALLRHPRGEVYVAAAWGLRRLAVPDTLPAALAFFEGRYDSLLKGGRPADAPAIDEQLAQLAQFFGRARYRPADAALRRLAPQATPANPADPGARAAAIWALGLIHETAPPAAVVTTLVGRLTAVHPGDVEVTRVRAAAAVALGRMNAAAAVGPLRAYYTDKKPSLNPVNNACGWAVARITGEPQPPPGTVEVVSRDWFLAPLD